MSKQRIDALLEQLTLEEQVSLLAGANFWTTVPVERVGVPAIKVTDGPNGARGGGSLVGGVTAACFPVGIALASTWNTELVEQIGRALADEALSKGARVLLAPTVNIHRSTLNGRNSSATRRIPSCPPSWRAPTSRAYRPAASPRPSSITSATSRSSSG
jgi:beta-glucosidase